MRDWAIRLDNFDCMKRTVSLFNFNRQYFKVTRSRCRSGEQVRTDEDDIENEDDESDDTTTRAVLP